MDYSEDLRFNVSFKVQKRCDKASERLVQPVGNDSAACFSINAQVKQFQR